MGAIAIGGLGGSGTRVMAGILQDLGIYIGENLSEALDNWWYALLFGRRDVLVENRATFEGMAKFFYRQMANPSPLTDVEERLLARLCNMPRAQHKPEVLSQAADRLRENGLAGQPRARWGWKVPYTHILIDRFFDWDNDLRYIHMTRDGLDMAFSSNINQLRTWGPIVLGRNVSDSPSDALAFWCATEKRIEALAQSNPGRIFQLSYDALIADPDPVLASLFQFLDMDVTQEQITAFRNKIKRPASVGRAAGKDHSVFEPQDVVYANERMLQLAAGNFPEAAPKALEVDILESRALGPGADHYRAYVGPPAQYDFMGASQFRLLTGLGLREDHHVLDIGCGSLRVGRFLMQYLLPNRYVGIEPNIWLIQEALQREIGRETERIKKPRFTTQTAFTPDDVGTAAFDMIVAQSIYSHTGLHGFQASVRAASAVLAPEGQFLFTIVTPAAAGANNMQPGAEAADWVYPACVTFNEIEVASVCAVAGLHVQALPWFHPRQTWFRAYHATTGLKLPPKAFEHAMGSGKPLFDDRFPS